MVPRISVPLVGILALCIWIGAGEAHGALKPRKAAPKKVGQAAPKGSWKPKTIKSPQAAQGGSYVKYKDTKQPVEARVEDLLSRMTVQEKIGQMTQVERVNVTSQMVKDYFIGSMLSAGGSGPRIKAAPQEWIDMVNEFQKGAVSTRLGIPMLYGIDAVHGHNNVDRATIFPHNIGLGATRDPELVRKIGEATALETRATGIPYAFAPCIAVCRDPRWGRCYESYSEDQAVVRQMTDMIYGLQGRPPASYPKGYPYVGGKTKVAGSAKHFVGDGGTIRGINENDTIIDWNDMLKIHMPAYWDSIENGISTVMISYSSWNGKKMHANYDLITNYLKGTLKFQGFVISDFEGIDKITSPPAANYTYSVETAINAGLDMIMVPYKFKEFISNMTYLIEKNAIPMSRIDDAVRRILRVKFAMGLFENPWGDYTMVDKVGCQEHRDLAREAVRKSLVLLKNGKDAATPMLPLPKNTSRILVAGPHANNLGLQCGGWTIEWQGQSGNNVTSGTTILGAISSAIDPNTEVVYMPNPDPAFVKSNQFAYAIIVVGETTYAETKGDNLNLTLPAPGPTVIENVCGNGVKCAVVLISGRPLVMLPHLPMIDALIAAWLPGSEGQGVADLLFGDYGFTGKLPRTWFKTVEQLPMNVGDVNYDPLFPYGFGLTTQPVPKPAPKSN